MKMCRYLVPSALIVAACSSATQEAPVATQPVDGGAANDSSAATDSSPIATDAPVTDAPATDANAGMPECSSIDTRKICEALDPPPEGTPICRLGTTRKLTDCKIPLKGIGYCFRGMFDAVDGVERCPADQRVCPDDDGVRHSPGNPYGAACSAPGTKCCVAQDSTRENLWECGRATWSKSLEYCPQ